MGVTFDTKFIWNQHINKIIRRSEVTLAVVRRLYGNKWGLRPGMVHWLYTRVVRPALTYAALVWWPKVMTTTTILKLSKIQRIACLGITGAFKTTPTTALEVLLDLPPLEIVIKAEARMALYRLQGKNTLETETTGHCAIWRHVGDPIFGMVSDNMTPVHNIQNKFEVFVDRQTYNTHQSTNPSDGLIWFTDGSKTEEGAGAGIYGEKPRKSFSFSLGKYTTVFQAEVYAILQCAKENRRRAYKNKRIHIFSDSQAALKALRCPKINSKLIAECLEELNALADQNQVKLIWVPGHCGIKGNEKADTLAKKGSATPLTGPEPALGIPKGTAREAIKKWIRQSHTQHWEKCPGGRQGKLFIKEPCKKRTEEILKLNRLQIKTITGLLSGHAPLKKHLNTMGLWNGNLDCRLCGENIETAQHIVCSCAALDRRRHTLFGQSSLEPIEINNYPIVKSYQLVNKTGLFDWIN